MIRNLVKSLVYLIFLIRIFRLSKGKQWCSGSRLEVSCRLFDLWRKEVVDNIRIDSLSADVNEDSKYEKYKFRHRLFLFYFPIFHIIILIEPLWCVMLSIKWKFR